MLKVLYLWVIQIITALYYSKSRHNVIYLMSFNNNVHLIDAMAVAMEEKRGRLIVLYTENARSAARQLARQGIKVIYMQDGFRFLFRILPIIMSGKFIFCDNYYPFLGGARLPRGVSVIQLWHANGAIKRFGWEDPRTLRRSRADRRRFQSVYNRFDQFVVASKAMGRVFERSYHVPFSRMRLWGYPRSDPLANPVWISQTRKRIERVDPELLTNRVILYAPTYREGVTFHAPAGIERALTADSRAIVVVKLHPLLKLTTKRLQKKWSKFSRIEFVPEFSTMELLTITDTLVTDYSSVAFDFSLLPNARSVWFFMFDGDRYRKCPGYQKDMLKWLPTKPIVTLKALRRAILEDQPVDFAKFNRDWNTYNDGHATERLIKAYFK